ncbi:PAS domain-containing protein [Natronorubrum sp. DTA28]|uniref:PAS domain-containing protein n=1 Tax=Natronorubrum sp. DTA28 TaxID=3447019 RepID=UPI003F87337B
MATSDPPTGTVQSRIRQQEVVAELGKRALESSDLDRFLADGAAAVREALGADCCGIFEVIPDSDAVALGYGVGWRDGTIGSATVPARSTNSVGCALETDEVVVATDVEASDRFSTPTLFASHDVTSAVSVGIDANRDEDAPRLVLSVYTTERREFADHELSFVRNVADVFTSAIENLRMRRGLETGLETTIDRFTDAFIGVDSDWRVTYVNDRARELTDREDDELIGSTLWKAFPATVESAFEREYRRAMATQEPAVFEEYYPPLETWFEVTAFPAETGLSISFRDVSDREATQRELQANNRTLQRLYAITADRELSFDEKTRELLDLGRERLGLEVGFMADIDERNDRFEVVHSSGDDERLRPGSVTQLSDTYCRRTIEEDELLVLTNAPVEGWGDDHAYEKWEFDSYLGGQLRVDGEPYGTLCFADDAPRSTSFTPAERSFVELLTQWLSYELERQHHQRELEESERRYRTLVEQFPNGIVALFDEELRYTLGGGQILEEIDISIDDFVGQTIYDRYDGETLETFESNFQAALSGERTSFEYDIHGREWLAHTVPVEDDRGEVFAGMIMVQDVTERNEQQRELREREARLERFKAYTDDILDAVDDVFYVVGEDGSFQRWNETLCAVTGYSDDEVDSMTPLDFFDGDDRQRVGNAIEGVFETGHARVEADVVTKEGETIPYEFAASTLENPAGQPVLTGVGRDISDRRADQRRLEELVDELEASNERLEQFAYAASHDLQEPLRMVASYLTLVDQRYADELDSDAEEFIEYAVDGARRMQEMIDGLLAYSRVDTQGDPFEVVDCEAVLEDVLTDLEVRIEETDADITVESLPEVYGDPGQLRQVFQNLLDNAITYSGDEAPRISVFAEKDGQEWRLSVRDRGIGIDPADTERIFQVFDRLHSVEEYAGTGIGLALCQRIVERHDGDIRVASTPGEGATFTTTLPEPPDADATAEPTGTSTTNE